MQPTRRSYSKSFKAQVIQECIQPGASTRIHPVAIKTTAPVSTSNICVEILHPRRADAIGLATEHMVIRAGTETALARVVAVFGAAKPHCAYLFANRRATRIKVLVHDGIGVWLAARRLNQGKFHWSGVRQGSEVQLDAEQLQALVLAPTAQAVLVGALV